ncbi:MAG: hypothetical protein EAZ09_04190 [Oscillatoriales cyanobacterium]|nr:MAG: hypothetical protein EAZ18_00625 [Oscillatoriales cyanobacterium]TAH24327.1 MAG: hypothetical protein EAZ09_04190 [Oscillatoriales cyanobacterium]
MQDPILTIWCLNPKLLRLVKQARIQGGNHRHKMPLKDRAYMCPNFGHKKNRDLNVAKNIDRWFEEIFIPKRSD